MVLQRIRPLLIGLLLAGSGSALAAQGTVIITDENCDYLLVDATEGLVLMKLIKGEMPRRGDTLKGALKSSDFNNLTNQSGNQPVNVWVDLIDKNTTKALMRYRQYCP